MSKADLDLLDNVVEAALTEEEIAARQISLDMKGFWDQQSWNAKETLGDYDRQLTKDAMTFQWQEYIMGLSDHKLVSCGFVIFHSKDLDWPVFEEQIETAIQHGLNFMPKGKTAIKDGFVLHGTKYDDSKSLQSRFTTMRDDRAIPKGLRSDAFLYVDDQTLQSRHSGRPFVWLWQPENQAEQFDETSPLEIDIKRIAPVLIARLTQRICHRARANYSMAWETRGMREQYTFSSMHSGSTQTGQMASAYSQEQLSQFLEHINLPKALREDIRPSLMLLEALHTHSLATFPYENLSLHYNATHTIDIDPQHLFRKMVTDKRGRGGFCMEIAILYNHILRAIGFDAYTAGVRTRGRLEGVPTGDYPGWNHIVNIITFPDGSKYHSDVAFGGDGATMPMPLIDDLVHENLGTQEIRLKRDWIPHQVHKTEETKLWIYQYRNGQDKEWNSFYSFPGVEFFALDWDVVNWWINTHADSHQLRNVLTIKFLLRPVESEASFEGEMEIYGKRMLVNGVVKENLGGKTQIITTCNIEGERVEALEKYFQISLTDEENEGIRGYVLQKVPQSTFTSHFNQLTPIISNSHTPQLLPMSHQKLITTLRTRSKRKVLMRLMLIDSRDDLLPLIVADDSPRNTVSVSQSSISFDTLPVKPSSRVEALTESEVAVDDGGDFA
ncbi:hypothetical protein LZL87_006871 [Fusarium oxysporum]|nr:hypothetical protein LZL87_006871 [Fusarium oxysporum]